MLFAWLVWSIRGGERLCGETRVSPPDSALTEVSSTEGQDAAGARLLNCSDGIGILGPFKPVPGVETGGALGFDVLERLVKGLAKAWLGASLRLPGM